MTRFTPTLDRLEGRDCPATVTVADRALYITTDSGADVVSVRDDGRGNVRATVTGADGEVSAAGTGLTRVFVQLRGTRDKLDYAIAGKVVRPVAVVVDAGRSGTNTINLNLPPDPGAGRGTFDLRGTLGRGMTTTYIGGAGLGGLTITHRGPAGAMKFLPVGVDVHPGVSPQTPRLPAGRG